MTGNYVICFAIQPSFNKKKPKVLLNIRYNCGSVR
jgi:hypothetical protein